MARIKVCPKCNHRTPSSQSQCICGESLFNIKAISEDIYEKQLANSKLPSNSNLESESHQNVYINKDVNGGNSDSNVLIDNTDNSSKSDGVLIKICPHCGSENRGVAKICKTCSTNIKQIKAEYRSNSNTSNYNTNNSMCNVKTKLFIGRLVSPDYSYSFDVDSKHPIIQIGREASMSEYLDEHMFTSRIHAEISIIGEKLAIKDLGKPNGTFINNKRLSPFTQKLLESGDKISLGGKWEDDWKNSQVGCFIVYYDD